MPAHALDRPGARIAHAPGRLASDLASHGLPFGRSGRVQSA